MTYHPQLTGRAAPEPHRRLLPPTGYWLIQGRGPGAGWSLLLSRTALYANGLLILGLLLAITASLALGSVTLTPGEVWLALLGQGSPVHQLVVQELRLMRMLAGLACGAAFGLAGCLMQTLARNRLATPGIIGIDNAATAFAVASVVTAGISLTPVPMSLLGAATATALAFGLAGGSGTQGYRFIVAGLGIGAVAGAITQLLLSQVAMDAANAAFPWTVGSLNARSPAAILLLASGLALCLPLSLALAKPLQMILISDAMSIGVGIRLNRCRCHGLVLSVLLTGLAVAVAGPVGMVALLGPELARLLNRQRGVPLLASALAGALLMLVADLCGRLLLAPLEIPVGIVTAIAGSPYLLWLLLNPRSRIQP